MVEETDNKNQTECPTETDSIGTFHAINFNRYTTHTEIIDAII